MTVDDLVDEGDRYLLAFPNATKKRVRMFLEDYVVDPNMDPRDAAAAGLMYGPEGMAAGPLVYFYRKLKLRWYQGTIDKAVVKIFKGR
jgi:hypothetical protein